MKSLQKHLIESINEDLDFSKIQKWLGNAKNHKKFAKDFNTDVDTVTQAFAWIEGSLEQFEEKDELIDFLHGDAPDSFSEYAVDELEMDETAINSIDWSTFFDAVVDEIKKM